MVGVAVLLILGLILAGRPADSDNGDNRDDGAPEKLAGK
jgi:hypothetical protein